MKLPLTAFFLVPILFTACQASGAEDVFAPDRSNLDNGREHLETWIITVNESQNYPPSVPEEGIDPLDYHDTSYSSEEFELVRFIQNEGIDFLSVPHSQLSLSPYAIDAISVMRPYKYDLVITSSPENIKEVFDLMKRYHQVERRKVKQPKDVEDRQTKPAPAPQKGSQNQKGS
ncbi:hypothetical protein H5P28_00620 [Ruficoccus amylovorans]|uniref:DUF3105 domain-containing protein n=1 Tax=Ruficoccus amylovorans TaxID=1804625 RepID=A0A842H897_9BACT|nr:hypothetical protein [Ruficoccus amylovorans]MBC2592753.1 hypothetical protein [Ruficoccus amylovorans]